MAYSFYRLGEAEHLKALRVGDVRRVLETLDRAMPVNAGLAPALEVTTGMAGAYVADPFAVRAHLKDEGRDEVDVNTMPTLTVGALGDALKGFETDQRVYVSFCGPVYQVEVREVEGGRAVYLEHEGFLFEADRFHDLESGDPLPSLPV